MAPEVNERMGIVFSSQPLASASVEYSSRKRGTAWPSANAVVPSPPRRATMLPLDWKAATCGVTLPVGVRLAVALALAVWLGLGVAEEEPVREEVMEGVAPIVGLLVEAGVLLGDPLLEDVALAEGVTLLLRVARGVGARIPAFTGGKATE